MVYLYKKQKPEINENVIINVVEINDLNIIVKLVDYNNMTGYIKHTDLSRRKRFNINSIVSVGKNVVANIIGYNNSSYGRIRFYKNRPVTTLELYKDKALPFETRCYLVKVLGVFGFMDLIKRNNL